MFHERCADGAEMGGVELDLVSISVSSTERLRDRMDCGEGHRGRAKQVIHPKNDDDSQRISITPVFVNSVHDVTRQYADVTLRAFFACEPTPFE